MGMNSLRRRLLWVASLAVASLLATGCSVLDPHNTPTFNLVWDQMIPAPGAKRIAAIPIVVPTAMTALAVDGAAIHPAYSLVDTGQDVADLAWSGMKWDEGYATACTSLPWRAGVTPVIFTGSFLGRTVFGAGNHRLTQSEIRKLNENNKASLAELRKVLEAGDYETANHSLDNPAANANVAPEIREEEQMLCLWTFLATPEFEFRLGKPARPRGFLFSPFFSRRGGPATWDPLALMPSLLAGPRSAEAWELIGQARRDADSLRRWRSYDAVLQHADSSLTIRELTESLADPDPLVRVRCVERVAAKFEESRSNWHSNPQEDAALAAALTPFIEQAPTPGVAAYAKGLAEALERRAKENQPK